MASSRKSSEMRTLVASVDSGIGRAIYDQLKASGEEVVGTSILGKGDIGFDLTKPFNMNVRPFNRLFFTIAARNPKTAEELFFINATRTFEFLGYAAKNLLEADAQVVVFSSHRGSIAECDGSQNPWYRMSKAALNMGVNILHQKRPKLKLVCVHPGLVRTDMTNGLYADDKSMLEPEECAQQVIRFVSNQPSFGFYDTSTGRPIKW